MPVSVSAFLIFYALVIPIGICIVLDHRPGWFRRGKILLWIAGLSAFSWVGVVGAILLPYCCGLSVPRGRNWHSRFSSAGRISGSPRFRCFSSMGRCA